MKEIKIKIDGLSIFFGGSSTYDYEGNIILRKYITEDIIEVALNHEYLHYIIHKFINKEASRRLDRFFYKNNVCIKGYDKKTKKLNGIDEFGVPC